MLAAATSSSMTTMTTSTAATPGAVGGDGYDDPQLQDLESLAQRIRALERILATPVVMVPTSKQTAGLSAGNTPTRATTNASGNESPTDEGLEETFASSLSPPPHQYQQAQSPQSPSRSGNSHFHQSRHGNGVHGHQYYHNNTTGNGAMTATAPGSVSRRVQKVESTLWAALKERKPIDGFLQKYESSKLINNSHESHTDKELLSLNAKIELILAAQDDLEKLADESKEIQSLERCTEVGGLKHVETLYPALSKLETIHIDQVQDVNSVSDKMNSLADSYNTLINTLSEVFLSWDAVLAAAEQRISELERE